MQDVSVVIATHDRTELLRRAISSVLAQEYDGFIEIVVVYDGEDVDDSVFGDARGRRVRAIANTRSPGLAGARNSGIHASDGELVAFCDDDDEWLPGKIQAQIELVNSGFETVVTGIIVEYLGHESSRVPSQTDVTLDALVRRRVMEAHPSTVLVSRHALASIGEVDEEIPGSYAEDYDWILRAAKFGPIGVVREPLVKVHWGQSLFSRNWHVIGEALDYLVAKHPEFQASPQGLARITGQRAFAMAAAGEGALSRELAKKALAMNPLEKRAYLALAVSLGLADADRILRWANRVGRGI
jgi:glycosyltransferase involved in cell wall biosynthesis